MHTPWYVCIARPALRDCSYVSVSVWVDSRVGAGWITSSLSENHIHLRGGHATYSVSHPLHRRPLLRSHMLHLYDAHTDTQTHRHKDTKTHIHKDTQTQRHKDIQAE